jgi:hypothetical protein
MTIKRVPSAVVDKLDYICAEPDKTASRLYAEFAQNEYNPDRRMTTALMTIAKAVAAEEASLDAVYTPSGEGEGPDAEIYSVDSVIPGNWVAYSDGTPVGIGDSFIDPWQGVVEVVSFRCGPAGITYRDRDSGTDAETVPYGSTVFRPNEVTDEFVDSLKGRIAAMRSSADEQSFGKAVDMLVQVVALRAKLGGE